MKHFKTLFIAMLAVFVVAGCSNDSKEEAVQEKQNATSYEAADEPMKQNSITGSETIVSVATGNQNLSTLVKAVKSADRVQMLSDSSKTYTVFAPTNEAFNALPEGTLEDLMKPENKQKLADILAYHVVEGDVMASDLEDGQTVTTAQGNTLKIVKKDGKVMVNGAVVVQADVKASNGMVHVIDKVLLPSN